MLRQAVILVGGLGTRLGERTRLVPKPLLEVGGRPFLDYLLDELTRYPTIEEIVLLAGHRADVVVDSYHGKRWRGASVTVVCEPAPCGTGGALKHAGGALQDRFFLLNGDSWFDFNLLDLALRAQSSSAIVHMALKRDQAGDRYGRVLLESNRVRSFLAAGAQPFGPINTGVYCVDRAILLYIDGMPCSLEQQVFPKLVAERRLTADLYDGFFIDIGIPTDFERVQHELPERLWRPAVFFDRDGVLNIDKAYVYRIEDFEWVEGAREAIKLCNDLGYYTFIVTNQSGVARGYYGVDDVGRLHDWMTGEFAEIGAHIDDYQFCPYHEDGTVEAYRGASDRRKPAPGMILDCLKAWPVRKEGSLLVGDNVRDIEAAHAAGIPGHLFGDGNLAAFLRPLLRAQAAS
ncbi:MULTISPECIES: HAD-IIIA family hydrolase [Bradyrhizobium]|uniref:HAD-IIIA family hydrolase n=1 Tax=Bradyrhizobium TaxID=374 RepID=UPI001CD61A48|nr:MULTISPECIES: HAD-IIIA family hydrolase [Bradyrhizobium]MCA1529377.1 HAD-IIIA family hydrolase [Bradyrhizobium yuanmingense]MCA1550142.1 HAD-IIIA family hydrolase [Bradyrhizobium sp. BRP19]